MKTNREAHEEAAGMGLCSEFFTLNRIDPDAPYVEVPVVAVKNKPESFWVIERFANGKSLGYWAGDNSRCFIAEIDNAIHFCRKDDAWRIKRGWHWEDTQVTEHCYLKNEMCGCPYAEDQSQEFHVAGSVGCRPPRPRI